eukprot:scaffold827_cov369-Prasinococcus_capsulatus_cf.AAC.12
MRVDIERAHTMSAGRAASGAAALLGEQGAGYRSDSPVRLAGDQGEGQLAAERRRWERQKAQLEEEKQRAVSELAFAHEKVQILEKQKQELELNTRELEDSLGVRPLLSCAGDLVAWGSRG